MVGHSGNAETRAPNGRPLTIDERPVTIPGDVLRASDVVREGDKPSEGALRLPRRDGNLDRKQAMELEVSEPLVRNLVSDQTGSGRGGRPAPLGEGGGATEPVIKSADGTKTKLASIVVSGEGRNSSFPRLRPLTPTDGGSQVTPAHVSPAGPDFASNLAAPIPFNE